MKADVWALGVTLYEFLFAKYPFQGSTVADYASNVCNPEVDIEPFSLYGETDENTIVEYQDKISHLTDLITRMLD